MAMGAYLRVTRADGSSDTLSIPDGEAIVGRSANVPLSFPTERELDLQHVLLVSRGTEGCWLSVAEGVTMPVLVAGKPYASGLVSWGTEFQIGKLRFKLLDRVETASDKPKIHPLIVVAAVVILGGFGWQQYKKRAGAIVKPSSLEAPALFSDDVECPRAFRSAQGVARLTRFAQDRGDRYAYDPNDGVRGVERYKQVVKCNEALGRKNDALEAAADMKRLVDRIEGDYAASRLRLGTAMKSRNWKAAVTETEKLLRLTAHLKDDPYVQWLRSANRQFAAKVIQSAK